MTSDATPSGIVYLVGAGPGDPRLITMRGVECLKLADLVLYDYLVNPALLQHVPLSADRVSLGHHALGTLGRAMSQEEINRRMVETAQQGKCVVRLKGGDPSIFARSNEEIEALRNAGLPFEVVPGITTAMAAAARLEVSLTDAKHASAVALVTGQERRDKGESCLNYDALANFPGTLVIYMGVTTAATWSQALIHRGKSPETPVRVMRCCSWPDELTLECTLETVATSIEEHQLRPPAIIVVGSVGVC